MLGGFKSRHPELASTPQTLTVGIQMGHLQSRKTWVPQETWCATFTPEIPVQLRSVNLREDMVGCLPVEITGKARKRRYLTMYLAEVLLTSSYKISMSEKTNVCLVADGCESDEAQPGGPGLQPRCV